MGVGGQAICGWWFVCRSGHVGENETRGGFAMKWNGQGSARAK